MTMEEYRQKLEVLYAKMQHEKQELIKEYSLANNKYKEGDIIEDHIGLGKIISIGFYISTETPQCVYQCKPLNKDGSYSKRKSMRTIYAMNIKH
jgi:hypothetical protein